MVCRRPGRSLTSVDVQAFLDRFDEAGALKHTKGNILVPLQQVGVDGLNPVDDCVRRERRECLVDEVLDLAVVDE